MPTRFEQWTRNSEALIVGAVIVLLAVAYIVSMFSGE